MARKTEMSTPARKSMVRTGGSMNIKERTTTSTLSTKSSDTLDWAPFRYVVQEFRNSRADETAKRPKTYRTTSPLRTGDDLTSKKSPLEKRLSRQHQSPLHLPSPHRIIFLPLNRAHRKRGHTFIPTQNEYSHRGLLFPVCPATGSDNGTKHESQITSTVCESPLGPSAVCASVRLVVYCGLLCLPPAPQSTTLTSAVMVCWNYQLVTKQSGPHRAAVEDFRRKIFHSDVTYKLQYEWDAWLKMTLNWRSDQPYRYVAMVDRECLWSWEVVSYASKKAVGFADSVRNGTKPEVTKTTILVILSERQYNR